MRSRIALSYVAAADELNVTPAAVGQLVRRLEEVIGIELFSPFAGRTRAANYPSLFRLLAMRAAVDRLPKPMV